MPPAQSGSAYRRLEPGVCLEGVLCFKYQRTVAKDNAVRLGEHTLQLLPGSDRYSYARARVEIQERLDASLVVAYQGRVIAAEKPRPFQRRYGLVKGHGGRLQSPMLSTLFRWTPAKTAARGAGRLRWASRVRIPAPMRVNQPSENPAPIILEGNPWW